MDTLPEKDVEKLRQRGLLKENEVAVNVGGVVVALDPVTGNRRQLDVSNVLLEANRQLLKG